MFFFLYTRLYFVEVELRSVQLVQSEHLKYLQSRPSVRVLFALYYYSILTKRDTTTPYVYPLGSSFPFSSSFYPDIKHFFRHRNSLFPGEFRILMGHTTQPFFYPHPYLYYLYRSPHRHIFSFFFLVYRYNSGALNYLIPSIRPICYPS